MLKMKKKLMIGIAALLSLTMLAGCQGNSPEKKESTEKDKEISILTSRTDIAETTYRDFADRFEAANPGIKLTIEAVKDYANIAKTRLAAGELTDIFSVVSGVKAVDRPNYYAPLDDLGLKGDLLFEEANTENGILYSVPSYCTASGLIYNKPAFEKAGITKIPTTLDELYDACEKLKAAGITPTTALYKDAWPTANWTYKLAPLMLDNPDYGAEALKTDTPFVKGTGMYEAVSIYRSLFEKGYFEEDLMSTAWEGFKPDLAKGKFGFILCETWLIPQIIENGAKSSDIGFFPLPTDNSGVLKTLLIPDTTLAINKDSKNVDAAKAYLKYLMNDGYAEWLEICGGLSARNSFANETMEQLQELKSYNPVQVETIAEVDEIKTILSKAQFKWEDLAIQSLASPDMESAMKIYNDKWAAARSK